MSATTPDATTQALYRLRPATDDDAAWLYDLHVTCMKEYVAQTWEWDDAVQHRMFTERFDPQKSQIVVVDGHDAGVVAVEEREADYFIGNIAVAPQWQGRGIGAAVIGGVLALAARAGKPVQLQVLRVNPARRLYERLGFGVTGETATHYLMATELPTDGERGEES